MSDAAPINCEDVSTSQIRLMGEDVLVRAVALEEVRDSGLWLQRKAQDFLGGCFYGEVVATGPGVTVREGPTPEEVAEFVESTIKKWVEVTDPYERLASVVAADVHEFLDKRRAGRTVPTQWKPGDRVAVRFGFGPEIKLREGLHHVVGRGNAEHGHGILAAWDAEHAHCWHQQTDYRCYAHTNGAKWNVACLDAHGLATEPCGVMAECACGARRPVQTRLTSCVNCPPGDRLAEAHRTDTLMAFPTASGMGPGIYEHAPIEDRPGDDL